MTGWDEMARDAGYRGEEARQYAAMLEADEKRRYDERQADSSAAADTLRDELAEALASYLPGHGSFGPQHWQGEADALLPVVRRYADAQVAAERERIAAEIEAHGATKAGTNALLAGYRAGCIDAARIARGQP